MESKPAAHRKDGRALRENLVKFETIQDMSRGPLEELEKVAELVDFSKGQELFAEGDPPGDLFLIIEGEVGLYTSEEVEAQAVDMSPRARSMSRKLSPTRKSTVGRKWKSVALSFLQQEGKLEFTVGAWNAVGLQSLMYDEPQLHTARCTEDCRIIVIKEEDFYEIVQKSLADDMAAKDQFLQFHLAGFREYAAGFRPFAGYSHASWMFVKRWFHCGHVFLQENALAEPAIFVIVDGSVEFLRTASRRYPALVSPRYAQNNALIMSSPRSKMFRMSSGAPAQKSPCRLLTGGVFGSAQVTSANQPEPFTLTAGAQGCEVYTCSKDDFAKLPPKVLNRVQEHLLDASRVRLARFDKMYVSDEDVLSPRASVNPRKQPQSTLTALAPEAGPGQSLTLGGAEQAKPSKFKAVKVVAVKAQPLSASNLRDNSYWFI